MRDDESSLAAIERELRKLATGAFDDGTLVERAEALSMAGATAHRLDQLTLVQDLRRMSLFDAADAGFYAAAYLLLDVADEATEDSSRLAEISDQMQDYAATTNAPYEDGWPLDEAPEPYLVLSDLWEAEYRRLVAEIIREHDEVIAALYENRRDDFDRQFELGRRFFHGPLPDET